MSVATRVLPLCWMLVAMIGFESISIGNEFPLKLSRLKGPVKIFLVHGSFAGNETWPLIVDEKVSFASELKRAAGKGLSLIHI